MARVVLHAVERALQPLHEIVEGADEAADLAGRRRGDGCEVGRRAQPQLLLDDRERPEGATQAGEDQRDRDEKHDRDGGERGEEQSPSELGTRFQRLGHDDADPAAVDVASRHGEAHGRAPERAGREDGIGTRGGREIQAESDMAGDQRARGVDDAVEDARPALEPYHRERGLRYLHLDAAVAQPQVVGDGEGRGADDAVECLVGGMAGAAPSRGQQGGAQKTKKQDGGDRDPPADRRRAHRPHPAVSRSA